MSKQLTSAIKKVLKANNIKNSVKTYGSTVTVTIKSEISEAVRDEVKALETVEAHGSIMDDTRWYTGESIQFRYEYEPTQEQIEEAQKLFDSWSDETKADKRVFHYHFTNQLREVFGPTGIVISEKIYKMY